MSRDMLHHQESSPEGTSYHEELHGQFPEQRDSGVHVWFQRRNKLNDLSAAELAVVEEELRDIPEVRQYDKERVTVAGIGELASLAHALIPERQRLAFASAEIEFQTMYAELTTLIDRYAETVRRFQSTKIASFHLDTDKYQTMMKNIDGARRSAHQTLIGHLHAFSRFLHRRLPTIAGSGFNHEGWAQYLKDDWFDIDRLKDRQYIGDWALRMDIAEKAQAVQSAIHIVLENKKADVEGINVREETSQASSESDFRSGEAPNRESETAVD